MLATVGKGDIIVTAKLDRAFRSAADALAVLEEFKEQGVGLHMIDLGGDVTGNGISKMVFTILAAVAEGERDRIRERIRDAKRHLTVAGRLQRRQAAVRLRHRPGRRNQPHGPERGGNGCYRAHEGHAADGATYRAIGAVTGHGPKSVQRILERMERTR